MLYINYWRRGSSKKLALGVREFQDESEQGQTESDAEDQESAGQIGETYRDLAGQVLSPLGAGKTLVRSRDGVLNPKPHVSTLPQAYDSAVYTMQ